MVFCFWHTRVEATLNHPVSRPGLTARLFRDDPETRGKYADRWRHVLVDEFQDTNGVQYEVLRLLASKHHEADATSESKRKSVFVVGDGDQAIYGWRGADYENQARYDDDFDAELRKLEKNYRSLQPILDAASALVSATARPRDDVVLEGLDAGARGSATPSIVVLEDQDAEAKWIADVCARATVARKRPTTVAVGAAKGCDIGQLQRLLSRSFSTRFG